MSYLEEYCNKILTGEISSCEKIKIICGRLLNDIYTPGEWHFDEEIANRHIEFIERFCRLPAGKLGAPFRLELYQKAQLQATFGFVDDDGIRRFTEVLIIEGRKNGKTSMLAAVLLDLLINDDEGAPQCCTAATKKDQAALAFDAAYKMILQSPELRKHLRKRVSDIFFPRNLGTLRALANNTNSLDGLDLHGCIIDELSAIKTRDTYDLLKQAMSARRRPLLFCITTNGFVRESIFDAQYNYAAGVLNGTIDDKRFLPFVYELDKPEYWLDESHWIDANPGIGTVKKWEYLRGMVNKAKNDPSFKPTVMVKDFNVPQSPVTAWLPLEDIINESTYTMEEISNSYAIGGCDLSAVSDLTCATLLIRKPDIETTFVLQQYFLPRKRIEDLEKAQTQEAPYKLWAEQGWLTITEGATVDYSAVTAWFVRMVEEFDIRPLWICYDRALAGYWVPEMASYGFDMERTPQGAYTWSQPMKEMGGALSLHQVNYNNNPILRWCLANTAKKSLNADGIESIMPVKIRKTLRIDGTVSLLNAWVGLVRHQDEYMPYLR